MYRLPKMGKTMLSPCTKNKRILTIYNKNLKKHGLANEKEPSNFKNNYNFIAHKINEVRSKALHFPLETMKHLLLVRPQTFHIEELRKELKPLQ